MEIIVSSKKLGSFEDGFGGYDLYAEVCKLHKLDGYVWSARIVECPEGYPDKVLAHEGGYASEGGANAMLDAMVAAYRRRTGLF